MLASLLEIVDISDRLHSSQRQVRSVHLSLKGELTDIGLAVGNNFDRCDIIAHMGVFDTTD